MADKTETTAAGNSRREAALRITPDLLIDLCKAKPNRPGEITRVVQNALPDDAKLERVGVGADGWLVLVVTSASFLEVPAGWPVPDLPPPVFETTFVKWPDGNA